MSPKTSLVVMCLLSLIGFPIMVFSTSTGTTNSVLLVIGCCFVFAGLIVNLIFWKCPHCGRHLPKAGFGMEYCPYCGEYID